MPHVLIVDDERDLADLLDFNLRGAGFTTTLVHSGAAALTAVEQRAPDLVLLDLMLPDISGTEVCRRLRATPEGQQLLIVMLTAKGQETERVHGFEVGADDYVTKPFSVRELVLRLKAILRRAALGIPSAPLQVGEMQLDPEAHRFTVAGQEVLLTALEFRLVHHLMSRPGRVQQRERLLEEVWGLSSEAGSRTLDTHVMRLREKLGPARQYVETVRGVGYRLIPPAARG